ncbi:GGDEF domain-containing protein [Thermus tengchongensis]|uniref:GGDEF domain-containing protein n=1 Tax=Thermus tengchongensis TaxID=1214928 RepID=UPI003B8A608A
MVGAAGGPGAPQEAHPLPLVARSEGFCVKGYEKPFSLVLLDLDDFKKVNDTQGHHEGDQLLKEVAQYLVAHVRQGDLVGRWGGEEFALLLPRTQGEEAMQVAERIRQGLKGLGITGSLGVAVYEGDLKDLFQRADRALYLAKERGKDRVERSL